MDDLECLRRQSIATYKKPVPLRFGAGRFGCSILKAAPVSVGARRAGLSVIAVRRSLGQLWSMRFARTYYGGYIHAPFQITPEEVQRCDTTVILASRACQTYEAVLIDRLVSRVRFSHAANASGCFVTFAAYEAFFITVDCMGVYELGSVAFRLALLRTWGHQCVRCKEPVTYIELHIDHFIPKSLDDVGLSKTIESFRLRQDYDLQETYNVVPSCGPRNISKGNRLPLLNHLTLETIETAKNLAPEVEKKADKLKKMLSAPVTNTLASIDANRDNPEVIQELLDYLLSIKASQIIEPELTMDFLLSEFVRLGLNSDGSSQVFSVGDCPNTNCVAGEVDWQTWDDGELRKLKAGLCYSCGTRAVSCPECGTETDFFGDEVDCDGGCGKRFRTVEHGGVLHGFTTV